MEPTGENHSFVLPRALDERTRAEILAHVDKAETSIARGEGIAITQTSMRQLATDVKQRGRARFEAENSAPR